jgi:hypothetical protein
MIQNITLYKKYKRQALSREQDHKKRTLNSPAINGCVQHFSVNLGLEVIGFNIVEW